MEEKNTAQPTAPPAAPEPTPPAAEPEPEAGFELTKEERLELENIQLRHQLCQQEQQCLGREQRAWGEAVSAAHSVDVEKYNISMKTGQCDLIQVGEPKNPAGGE